MDGYRRDLFADPEALILCHGEALRALIGRRLSSSWVAWDVGKDARFVEAPVILDFEGWRLELDCYGVSTLSVTWNTLDVDVRPRFRSVDEPALGWRRDSISDAASVVGKTVTHVSLLQRLFGWESQSWVLVGVEFTFDEGFLSVHNGLDHNAMGTVPLLGEAFRRRSIG